MFARLKQSWQDLKKRRPGHRFEERYEQSRAKAGSGGGGRTIKLVVGILLVLVGIVLLVIPGPGSLFIVIGGAFLAEESRTVARFLDRTELAGRRVIARFT